MSEERKPSDELLTVRCQLGDRDSWDMLVQRWNPKLRSFVSRMLSEQSVVDDTLQEIWLRVVRSMSRLDDPGKFAGWVFQIARATVTDQIRRKYRMPVVEPECDVEIDDSELERLILSESIESALRRLHPIDREAIHLHYFEHFSVADVATVCGVPAGTVKSRLHRGRKVLRSLLSPEESLK